MLTGSLDSELISEPTRLKNPVCPTILPIAARDIFMLSPRKSAQDERKQP